MARPRTPTATLETKGSFKNHPDRRRPKEPKPKGPLGEPPEHLTELEAEIWNEFLLEAPDGVLTVADRKIVGLACRLEAKVRSGKLSVPIVTQLRICLSTLGMTPADRSKVEVPPAKPKGDEWDELTEN